MFWFGGETGLSGMMFVVQEEYYNSAGNRFIVVTDNDSWTLTREQFYLFSLVYVGEL